MKQLGYAKEVARLLAAVLIAAALVVPLLFSISTQETFVLPKLIGLGVFGGLGLGLVVMSLFSTPVRELLRPNSADALVAVFVVLLSLSFWFSIDRSQSLLGERLQRQGYLPLLGYGLFYFLARLSFVTVGRLWQLARGVSIGAT